MAAEIIDERMLEDEISKLEELEVKEPEQAAPPQEPKQEDFPEKYRNKSLSDIVRMHQEAEKLLGRQSSEVGELRKVVDDFITKQTELTSTKKPPEDVDFFADPKGAVNSTIESHPAFKKLEELTVQQRQAAAQAQLINKHPDAQKLIADSNFMEWVMASKVRQSLLVKADREFDVDAADELFSTWKERQSFAQQTVSTEKDARKATVNKAATGSSSVSSDGFNTAKKYRRADIVKLMIDDPDRYEALLPEIGKAYKEGRVI